MKRGSRVPCLALLALTTLGTTAATEGKFQKLTAGQIRAKLAGMELTDNVHWRDLYQTQSNGDEYLHGSQKNRQMASRAQPTLHRVRKRADTEMLRRLAHRKTGRAAARRPIAVAGYP